MPGDPTIQIEARRLLDAARRRHYEDGDGAYADAVRCRMLAGELGDRVLAGRALTLQAAVLLQRGDLRGAFDASAEAETEADRTRDDRLIAELASVRAHLSFFVGRYAESLLQAERAIDLADDIGDLELRVFARRSSCLVFGNVGVSDLRDRVEALLRLTIEYGDPWEEAMSRNDLAHFLMESGDLAAAEEQLAQGFALAATIAPRNRFALGVLGCTRAEVRLRADRVEDALADAEEAERRLTGGGEPNPYVLAMTTFVAVQALLALGRFDDSERVARAGVERLGDRVPQARSLVLRTLATALRDAGRAEEAFDALAESADIERRAFSELSELQRGLERAQHEARTLREQADRDWLTGLHNRRYLSRQLGRRAADPGAGPFTLVVLDLDHFKAVNDRFGHEVGDRVLVRVASLLLGEMREQDTVVRTGGEEFVLLMPDTGANAALAACERLRRAIRDESWDDIAAGLALTASVGVATADHGDDDLEALATIADARLYEAKRGGRDRVVAA